MLRAVRRQVPLHDGDRFRITADVEVRLPAGAPVQPGRCTTWSRNRGLVVGICWCEVVVVMGEPSGVSGTYQSMGRSPITWVVLPAKSQVESTDQGQNIWLRRLGLDHG